MKRGRFRNKKGQVMSLPFTLIFSVIITAVVIFVGFYVINMFLKNAEQVKLRALPDEVQAEVVKIWSDSDSASRQISLDCSKKIKSVCFTNFSIASKGVDKTRFDELKQWDEDANFFYYPLGEADKYSASSSAMIKCGNIACLQVKSDNPLCLPCDGEITFTLTKDVGSPFVYISR